MKDYLDFIWEWLFERDRLGGRVRSSRWREVRNGYASRNPNCEACGAKDSILNKLNIHHCEPFHLFPEKELLDSNLISLCRQCHLTLGHLRSFKSFNKDIREDATTLLKKIKSRP